jgi:formylglycine-generating enzyme required for sulfatase activity
VPAADGRQAPLYLFRLPDGSDMEMVAVPAGDFVMGADDPDAPGWEKPEHTHPMEHSYWIGRNDVTRGQFKAFCTATGRAEPEKAYFDDKLEGDTDRHPVIMVSWDDAKAYCAWAGLVLPAGAEWEKAARGADGRKYPWGNAWDPRKANFLAVRRRRPRAERVPSFSHAAMRALLSAAPFGSPIQMVHACWSSNPNSLGGA